jgi:hypothetical protein
MAAMDQEYIALMIEEHNRQIGELLERVTAAEQELAATVKRRDSVEIGTPAKGGALKLYFDAGAPAAENEALMVEAKRVLGLGGGSPAPSTLPAAAPDQQGAH